MEVDVTLGGVKHSNVCPSRFKCFLSVALPMCYCSRCLSAVNFALSKYDDDVLMCFCDRVYRMNQASCATRSLTVRWRTWSRISL